MNPKLQKHIADRERKAQRITTLQGQVAVLGKKIAEMERLELHSLLRGANMTYQDLATYIRAQSGQNDTAEEIQEAKNDEDE